MAFIKSPNIIEEQISDSELMLYNQSTEEVHILNESSTQIYTLICSGHSLVEALYQYIYDHIGEMCDEKPITIDELATDAKSAINMLLANGIICEEIADE